MTIQAITPEYREAVNKILKDEWHCPPSVSRGKVLDTTVLPGFVSLSGGLINGVVTYNIENSECEIATLNSFDENKGIGTGLINAVLSVAKANKCGRLWLVTSNDDIGAIRFYQKRGLELAAVHINAMDIARKIKPAIPLMGMHGIPIKHEFEFELKLLHGDRYNMNPLKVKKLSPAAKIPTRATESSAGYDLYACLGEPLLLPAGGRASVPIGIAVEIENGYAGFVYGRSGLGVKHGIVPSNAVGVIDSDYRGEIMVGLSNHSGKDYLIQPIERVAQLVIQPVATPEIAECEELSATVRGSGGFGSTGR